MLSQPCGVLFNSALGKSCIYPCLLRKFEFWKSDRWNSDSLQNFYWPCNASVNSKHQHPPRADPRGNFLKWSKTLPRGKIFLQKHCPRDKKIPTPGEYCEKSSQLFLLVGVAVEILEFCRNQTLKRTGRLFKSYPLVSVLKFSPSFQTDFVTREQQRDGTSVWSWKVPSCGINWQLGTLTLCNRFDPRGPPGNSDGTNPGTRAESWRKSPGVARGDVGAWNWLMHKDWAF